MLHKSQLLDILSKIELNDAVQNKLSKIPLKIFNDEFNLLKLQTVYGFDNRSALLVYKYHVLKEISFGNPIAFTDNLYMDIDLDIDTTDELMHSMNIKKHKLKKQL